MARLGAAGQGFIMLPTRTRGDWFWKDVRGIYWCDLLTAHGKGEPRIATRRYRPDKGPPNVCEKCYRLLTTSPRCNPPKGL